MYIIGMRIVIFAHSFPPVIGGGQTYQYYLAKFLSGSGHDVRVVTGSVPEEYSENKFSYDGFEVVRIDGFKEISKFKIPIRDFLDKAYEAIEPFKPDIVYSQGFVPCLIYSFLQYQIPAKHVFTYHSTPIIEEEKIVGMFKNYAVEKSFSQFIFKNCPFDLYIANSQYYYDNSMVGGMDKNKSTLVYHGIDLQLFNDRIKGNKAKFGYADTDYVIVCPIRLIERKGILDILDALSLISDKNVKLFIPTSRLYTSTEFENKVYEKIKDLKLAERVQIVFDKIDMFGMPEVYAMADLMVLPSYIEGLGIVLLEALATGTPVVAMEAQGVTEIIKDNFNGYLSQKKNPKDLASKIMLMKDNPKDALRLTKTGQDEIKEKFDIVKQVKKIEKLFESLVG